MEPQPLRRTCLQPSRHGSRILLRNSGMTKVKTGLGKRRRLGLVSTSIPSSSRSRAAESGIHAVTMMLSEGAER